MVRLSEKTRVLLLLASIAVSATIGLGGGCNDAPASSKSQSHIYVTEAASADTPLDCVPDPDAMSLYYIASKGADRAVFKVDLDGTVSEIFTGAPLVDARGISISTDGTILYIADPGAPNGGAVYSLEILGGTPAVVKGTEGSAPRAIDIHATGKTDLLTLAGKASDGAAAVLEVPASGGTAKVVYKGSPLQKPDGVVATTSGLYYVTDAGTNPGKVFQIDNGTAKAIGGDVTLGSPAGISTLQNEAAVLVSSLSAKGTSQVVIIDPAANTSSTFDGTIGVNKVSGGLHRAQYSDLFGWAGRGSVYRVKVVVDSPSSTPGGPGD